MSGIGRTAVTRVAIFVGVAVAALLVRGGARPAQADSGFRCGSGRLVDKGDRAFDVRNKCGDPDAVTTRVEKRTIKEKVRRHLGGGLSEDVTEEREVEVLLDEWVYDLGDRRFVRYVAFENDRVIDISTGQRGSRR
jgi:hypothetical protein